MPDRVGFIRHIPKSLLPSEASSPSILGSLAIADGFPFGSQAAPLYILLCVMHLSFAANDHYMQAGCGKCGTTQHAENMSSGSATFRLAVNDTPER